MKKKRNQRSQLVSRYVGGVEVWVGLRGREGQEETSYYLMFIWEMEQCVAVA